MSDDSTVLRTTAVSVVVDLKPSSSAGNSGLKTSTSSSHSPQVRIAVAAQIPRSRTGTNDRLMWTLQHWMFWDDRRQYTHLDALLTRLAPLSVVHLGCTESAQVKEGKNGPSPAAARRAKHVTDVLTKLNDVIDTRTDLTNMEQETSDSDDAGTSLVHVHPSLPPHNNLQDILEHVLGETACLAYRGSVLEELVQKSLALLLNGQGSAGRLETTHQTCDFQTGVLNSHMVLDRTASEAINLLPPAHAGLATLVGGRPGNNSLFGILNQHCLTKVGSRTLLVWLRQPLVDLAEIQRRQDAVAFLVEDNLVDQLRDEGLAGLSGVDLDALGGQLASYAGGVLGSSTSKALASLYKLHLLGQQQLPILHDALHGVLESLPQEQEEGEASMTLLQSCKKGLEAVTAELGQAVNLAEAVLDMDEAPRNFMVKPTFNDEMAEVKQEVLSVEQELHDCHEAMNERWSEVSGQPLGQVRLEETTDGSWQFRLPNTNDSKVLDSQLRNEVKVHRLLKNGVYFSNKELRQTATKKQDLLAEYDRHQHQIVVDAMKVAATYAPVMERCSSLVAQLDVVSGLAHLAKYSPTGYCRPVMTDGEEDGLGIELKGARHPCVELQDSIEYIPNDISLIFGKSSFLLVTGPNMGGKSTYIRALGAIVTLAQIGSYVPCSSATVNIVHHILARVGAGDAQDRGISTFMAEMLEASAILRTATKRSLIIIDELGRGTSTYDGYGLATAISEYIIQRIGCMTVFATHFHEVTALEDGDEAVVKNSHVTATRGTNGLTFLYEVRPGPCLESFGIQVAEMAHVPQSVVADAKRRAKHLENFDYLKKQKDMEEGRKEAEFLQKFKELPMNSFATAVEKREAVMQLMKEYNYA